MCYIKRTEITYADGQKDTRDAEPILCNRSQNGRTCSRIEVGVRKERSSYSKPSSSSPSIHRTPAVVHQPRESYFSPTISIGLDRLRPTYSIKRASRPKSEERSLVAGGSSDGHSERQTKDVLPAAPMPPPRDLRPRPTNLPPRIQYPPSDMTKFPQNGPVPPRSPTYRTVDTVPSSSRTPSIATSSKSKKHRPAPPPKLVISHDHPAAPASPTSSHRSGPSLPGLSRLRRNRERSTRHDSAYGSSNISPVDGKKSDIGAEESRSTTTSRRGYNELYNYTNDNAADDDDDESGPSMPRSILRVGKRLGGDPETTDRKMQQTMREAMDHQSQSSVLGEEEGHEQHRAHRRHRKRHSH